MLDRISKVLMLAITWELCLGGGGRLTAIGPISLRMILFCSAMVLTGLMLAGGKRIPSSYSKILGLFLFTILVGVGLGWWHGSSIASIAEDVKPLLYFLMLPFFALAIDKPELNQVIKTIKASSVIMVTLFFAVLILIHSRAIPFLSFYRATEKSVEFFYRGELSFFYKGFLFLGIGFIFYFFSDSGKRYFFMSLLLVAIILSVTRGLLFSLCLTFSVYTLWQKSYKKFAVALTVALAIVVWGNKGTSSFSRWVDSSKREKSFAEASPNLLGNRNYSDEGRMKQIEEVVERISIPSVLVGHGFGQGIPIRPVHMEIAYLEVFHKQGIVGLSFWSIFALMIFRAYQKSDRSSAAHVFFYASVFVFIESVTNQYFNNPIGMSVLLLSLVSLDKLGNKP